MIAKTRKEYTDAWRTHFRQLQNLYIDSDMPFKAWKQAESEIEEIIEMAADRCFPDAVAESSELPDQEAKDAVAAALDFVNNPTE